MKRIALSTTVPIEIILAAGLTPVDLNNTFVTSAESQKWIERAEVRGFPKSSCAWIKGLYSACHAEKPDAFLAVTEGDCSHSGSLHQILEHEGIEVLTFAYPASREASDLERSLEKLAEAVGTTLEEAEDCRRALLPLRALGKELDRLTYETHQVSGFENHLWLVNFSDFGGDPSTFERDLKRFIEAARERPPKKPMLRLGYVGVPPMTADVYDYVESLGGQIVFNEVQRQFAMPEAVSALNLTTQYTNYSYPYDLCHRLKDIEAQILQRDLDGIIHYTQAFCHRALDDIILKEKLALSVLTLEGDKATQLDSRSKLRIEAFMDMLQTRKREAVGIKTREEGRACST